MTAAAAPSISAWKNTPAPVVIGALAFCVAFGEPVATLVRDWWTVPEASHGLLLAPVALWLAWRRGLVGERRPQPAQGFTILLFAILLRFGSGLAAELFTMRFSLLAALAGLVVYAFGLRQLAHWWLPCGLILLSVPLPEVVLGSLALPLQFKASQWGTAMLALRHVPVRLAGNVIHLPGRALFVTEACSGLRSLTALLALGLLIGGLWLRTTPARVLLVAAALPVAMLLNAVRIFLTGLFVYFVSPSLAEGLMHYTQGWVIFIVAFAILGALAWLLTAIEAGLRRAA